MIKKSFNLFLAALLLIGIWLSFSNNLSLFNTIRRSWDPSKIGQDPVSGWEKRLENIKGDLPKSGVVGYVSEKDIPGAPYNAIDTDEEYVMTQYFLAPLIVARGADHPYVIGNFGNSKYDYQVEETLGLKLVQSYGMGIFLYERPGK